MEKLEDETNVDVVTKIRKENSWVGGGGWWKGATTSLLQLATLLIVGNYPHPFLQLANVQMKDDRIFSVILSEVRMPSECSELEFLNF